MRKIIRAQAHLEWRRAAGEIEIEEEERGGPK